MRLNRAFINVLLLGFGFMFVFTAFQTMGNIQATVLTSIQSEDPGFTGDGFTSLAIVYLVFAAANWLAPSVISILGYKWSMVLGGLTYALFIGNFLIPETWLLYLMSAVVGVGAAVIWTAQGSCLTVNSDTDNMSRNSGLFWALLQCSMFFGNLFVYFVFAGKTVIDQGMRQLVCGVLIGCAGIGLVLLFLIKSTAERDTDREAPITGPLHALVTSFRLFRTYDMLLLSCTFFYTGLELSFFSGVYGTCLGNTASFGSNAKSYVGLNGIFLGAGEVIGGAAFGLLGGRTTKHTGRDPVVVLGFLLHTVAFYCIFLNVPDSAPLHLAYDTTYITSNVYLAMLCSLLLGFGDSCFNTQIYPLIGSLYGNNSAPAFALFKFAQSLAAAIAFFYSTQLTLAYQLGILVVFNVIGTLTYCIVEWKSRVAGCSVARPDTPITDNISKE